MLNWEGPGTQPQSCSKDSWKFLPLLTSINWPSLVTYWVVAQKIYSKMHPVLCTNTHHDVTDLVNHGMVKNTKIWISWERNITFLRSKKNYNLCLRWHILRSYDFAVEVTFKVHYFLSFLKPENSTYIVPPIIRLGHTLWLFSVYSIIFYQFHLRPMEFHLYCLNISKSFKSRTKWHVSFCPLTKFSSIFFKGYYGCSVALS